MFRIVVWGLIGLFSFAYVLLALLNHAHFRTGLDLATYGQALFQLSHGRLPFSTLKEQVLWGDHAHFILVFLAPWYRLFPDVRLLLVLQPLAVTLSGWAFARLARALTRSRTLALSFLTAYLSFIGLQHAIDFDFHPSVLTGAAIVWLLFAAHEKRWWLLSLALVLGLATREDAAPIIFMVGFTFLLRRRWRLGGITMAVSALYFLTVAYIIMPRWTPGNIPLAYLETANKHPLAIIRSYVRYPLVNLQNMLDTPEKMHTITTLFWSFGWLPLLSPFTFLAGLPIFLSRFLSPDAYRWLLKSHSNANILPILAYGALLGTRSVLWLTRRAAPRIERPARLALCVLLLAGTLATGWFDSDTPLRRLFKPAFVLPTSLPHETARAFRKAREIIGPQDGVSASSGFLPTVSGRASLANFPTLREDTKWILLAPKINTWPLRLGMTEKAIKELKRDPAVTLVFEEATVVLFRRKGR